MNGPVRQKVCALARPIQKHLSSVDTPDNMLFMGKLHYHPELLPIFQNHFILTFHIILLFLTTSTILN
jgi:hypothetical protein